MDTTYYCDNCGEINDLQIDESAGMVQEFVIDCSVCCHPMVITISYNEFSSRYDVDVRREDR